MPENYDWRLSQVVNSNKYLLVITIDGVDIGEVFFKRKLYLVIFMKVIYFINIILLNSKLVVFIFKNWFVEILLCLFLINLNNWGTCQ